MPVTATILDAPRTTAYCHLPASSLIVSAYRSMVIPPLKLKIWSRVFATMASWLRWLSRLELHREPGRLFPGHRRLACASVPRSNQSPL